MSMPSAELATKLDLLPDQPGVYSFHSHGGEVLYVGKAKSLRNRVRSYFQSGRQLDLRKEQMVEQVADLEYIVTRTAVEALAVESNLIKKHHPRYNIRLRDDKQYPYVRVGVGEEYPGVTVVRHRAADGARYFGPFTQSRALRDTLRTLRKVFPYRSCTRVEPRPRACLNHFIGRCPAPCLGQLSPAQYRENTDGLLLFLSGRADRVVDQIAQRMTQAATRLDFERAAVYRDQMTSLRTVIEGQRVTTETTVDRDVIAIAGDPVETCAEVFFFRHGNLVGREAFFLRGAAGAAAGEAMEAFLTQFYERAAAIPREVLLSDPVEDSATLRTWLRGLRGGPVDVRAPQRGEGKQLVEMARNNAQLALAERHQRRELDQARLRQDLLDLQSALGLSEYPHRIECFDVSNVSGQDAVASMVVFEGGQPKKSDYRRFRLRTPGPDDYAMMAEALRRRLRRRGGEDAGESFNVLPDLIVVDGGKGQVEAAASVLAQEGLAALPVVGLAKQHEVLYAPGDRPSVVLPDGSGALFVVMRLRDEAHRFAVAYHRKLRQRRTLRSSLDEIPGVGKARRTALLRHFGSGRAIAAATLADLLAVPGLPGQVARDVYQKYHGQEGGRQDDGIDEQADPPGPGGA